MHTVQEYRKQRQICQAKQGSLYISFSLRTVKVNRRTVALSIEEPLNLTGWMVRDEGLLL